MVSARMGELYIASAPIWRNAFKTWDAVRTREKAHLLINVTCRKSKHTVVVVKPQCERSISLLSCRVFQSLTVNREFLCEIDYRICRHRIIAVFSSRKRKRIEEFLTSVGTFHRKPPQLRIGSIPCNSLPMKSVHGVRYVCIDNDSTSHRVAAITKTGCPFVHPYMFCRHLIEFQSVVSTPLLPLLFYTTV